MALQWVSMLCTPNALPSSLFQTRLHSESAARQEAPAAFQHPPASATPRASLSYLRTVLSELQRVPGRIPAAADFAAILPKGQRWCHLREGQGSWGALRLRKVQGGGRIELFEETRKQREEGRSQHGFIVILFLTEQHLLKNGEAVVNTVCLEPLTKTRLTSAPAIFLLANQGNAV